MIGHLRLESCASREGDELARSFLALLARDAQHPDTLGTVLADLDDKPGVRLSFARQLQQALQRTAG